MSYIFLTLFLFSSLSFLFYGGICLFTKKMNSEFERYGFAKYQKLIGILEILGALGLLLGYFNKILLATSALCLSLVMLSAILVRIKIKDPFILHLPAILLFFINLYLFYTTLSL